MQGCSRKHCSMGTSTHFPPLHIGFICSEQGPKKSIGSHRTTVQCEPLYSVTSQALLDTIPGIRHARPLVIRSTTQASSDHGQHNSYGRAGDTAQASTARHTWPTPGEYKAIPCRRGDPRRSHDVCAQGDGLGFCTIAGNAHARDTRLLDHARGAQRLACRLRPANPVRH